MPALGSYIFTSPVVTNDASPKNDAKLLPFSDPSKYFPQKATNFRKLHSSVDTLLPDCQVELLFVICFFAIWSSHFA